MDSVTLPIIIAIAATFFFAGTIKGIIGLGLPSVSLALLTVILDLPQAMALLLIPSFLTNIWQAVTGTDTLKVFKRIWPFILAATFTVWIGALALTRIDLSLLSALLGILLIAYALISLAGIRLSVPTRHEIRTGIALGTINGILTGMTGSFVMPGVMFLQAIGLPRDTLISAMGMLFTASTLALAMALGQNNLLNSDLVFLSALAVIPAIAGMAAGQKIRKKLSEPIFRKVFFISLLCLGCYITGTAIFIG